MFTMLWTCDGGPERLTSMFLSLTPPHHPPPPHLPPATPWKAEKSLSTGIYVCLILFCLVLCLCSLYVFWWDGHSKSSANDGKSSQTLECSSLEEVLEYTGPSHNFVKEGHSAWRAPCRKDTTLGSNLPASAVNALMLPFTKRYLSNDDRIIWQKECPY